jgi:E1A-binding protein p400
LSLTKLTSICSTVALDAEDCPNDRESRKGSVLIDSLFIMDQFKATERVNIGKPNTKDIAEVTAVAEAVLPKGSARVTTAVRHGVIVCKL